MPTAPAALRRRPSPARGPHRRRSPRPPAPASGSAVAQRCIEEGATVADQRRPRAPAGRGGRGAERAGRRAGRVGRVQRHRAGRHRRGSSPPPIDQLGHIDVLINNAGLGGTADLVEMTDEQWSLVLDVTLTGTFRATRAALQHMVPRGAGVIVNNASVLGWRAQAGQAHYAAAKAGVMALTRCAAIEAAPAGIRVNAVAPSLAMHPFLAKVTSDELLDELTSAGGLRPRRRAVGGGQRDGVPGQRLRLVPDRRGHLGQQPARLSAAAAQRSVSSAGDDVGGAGIALDLGLDPRRPVPVGPIVEQVGDRMADGVDRDLVGQQAPARRRPAPLDRRCSTGRRPGAARAAGTPAASAPSTVPDPPWATTSVAPRQDLVLGDEPAHDDVGGLRTEGVGVVLAPDGDDHVGPVRDGVDDQAEEVAGRRSRPCPW